MSGHEIQYVSNGSGEAVAVLVPIELWHEIASERETAYLLKRDTMRNRLAEARKSTESFSIEEVRAKCGL